MKVRKYLSLIEGAITEPRLAMSDAMVRAIACAASPAAVAYFLRANPAIAEELSGMSAQQAERQIEKIDEAWSRMDDKIADAHCKRIGADYWS